MRNITSAFNWKIVYDTGNICKHKNKEVGMV